MMAAWAVVAALSVVAFVLHLGLQRFVPDFIFMMLLYAARLWRLLAYQQAVMALLAQVKDKKVVDLPMLGPMLLPGAVGFAQTDKWRLNLSYLPLPLLRKLARVDGNGPWLAMIASTQQLLRQSSPQGFAPDWLAYDVRVGLHQMNQPPTGG